MERNNEYIALVEVRGNKAKQKALVSLYYKGFDTGKYYEADVLVDEEIVIELKSVEAMIPLFDAQIISYLKLTDKPLGFLVNFNVPLLKNGFKRFVNNF